jgi:phosphoserine phosphatase
VPSTETVLVQVSGPDRPGISAGLFARLAEAEATVGDVEQVVIRGRLSLGVVIDVPGGRDLLKELLLFAWDHGLEIDFDVVDANPTAPQAGFVVTALGPRPSPADLLAVTRAITEGGGNIHRIVRLSRYPVFTYELLVHGGDFDAIREQLVLAAADRAELDVAIQRGGLGRRANRLVVLDVDSTLIQDEVIDLLAHEAGCSEAVAAVTERAMAGELDFAAALEARVATLAGLDADALDRAYDRLRLTPGARTFVRTLRRLGFTTAIVSGGFSYFTDRLADTLGIDHAHANELEIVDGRLTGRVVGEIVNRDAKARLLKEIAQTVGVGLDQTVAVGDGANDLDMLAAAGLGIAFNAKPVVRDAADTAVSVPYLDAILFLLGVSREEIEAADASDNGGSEQDDPEHRPREAPGDEPGDEVLAEVGDGPPS